MDSSSSNTLKYCGIMLEGPISEGFQLMNPGPITVLKYLSQHLSMPILRNPLLQLPGFGLTVITSGQLMFHPPSDLCSKQSKNTHIQ